MSDLRKNPHSQKQMGIPNIYLRINYFVLIRGGERK